MHSTLFQFPSYCLYFTYRCTLASVHTYIRLYVSSTEQINDIYAEVHSSTYSPFAGTCILVIWNYQNT